jgi:predicted transcriptional regulator
MTVMGGLEQAVMDILWNRPEALSVRDVHELLAHDRDLAYTTVMTVLDRLAKKGLVLRNLDGRAWLYRPANSRATQIASEMLDLMGQLSDDERREVLSKIVPALG